MAEVQWIKIATNLFDNRKIKQIECLPEKDTIIVIWIKLICLAGSINDGGQVYFLKGHPYTADMLATQFNRPSDVVSTALDIFSKFGMIEVTDGFIEILNWEKYQNVDGMERIREQNRIRKQRQRERDSHVTVTQRHGTDKIREEEIREEENPSLLIPITPYIMED